MTELLTVRDLRVDFDTPSGPVRVIDGLDLTVAPGERVALVGESGSGKSVTAQAILGLLPTARVTGSVRLDGQELVGASRRILRQVRGNRIGLVFQDPLSSLNPVMTIGRQVMEPLLIRGVRRAEARRRAIDLLARLGVRDAARRFDDYPHQFSGGMRQRGAIALAAIAEPDLLIADEPTTALDVRIQAQVLSLLDEIAAERRMAVLLITHDLGIVAGFAQRVVVMYAGREVEQGPVDEIFGRARHPYTRGLLAAVPRIDERHQGRLPTIGGQVPTPAQRPDGCAFHPRCSSTVDACRSEVPLLLPRAAAHRVACHVATRHAEQVTEV